MEWEIFSYLLESETLELHLMTRRTSGSEVLIVNITLPLEENFLVCLIKNKHVLMLMWAMTAQKI